MPEEKNEEGIPHLAVLIVRGVVNRQMPGGMWHPAAVFNDGFTVKLFGQSEAEVVEKLKEQLEKMKESCQGLEIKDQTSTKK